MGSIIAMSWVREAIDDAAAKSNEELYPTVHGSSPNKPDVRPSVWLSSC